MWIIWVPPVLVVCIIIYMVSYTLLRTSGDGRPATQRLLHPSKGDLQEEYGGTGESASDKPKQDDAEKAERHGP